MFLGTADEEVGGEYGAGWFARERLAELHDAEFLLNEGGAIRERSGGDRSYDVAVAEKVPLWLRLTATGEPGHGSVPRGETAVVRLIRALARVADWRQEVRVTPEVQAYFRALAPAFDEARRRPYEQLPASLDDPAFRDEFFANPRDAALVRNTCVATVLRGSEKTNVIPRTAGAEIDCRLLPDEDPDAFLAALRRVVGDDVEIEVLLRHAPSTTSTETRLFEAIAAMAGADGLRAVPAVLAGFTDTHFFRARGIAGYGFVPVVLSDDEARGAHGVDERLSTENLREGTRRLVAILRALDE
jgi:acetylornithine deacetylase/succinyl-diaminopimelate desuccinylase-like protein